MDSFRRLVATSLALIIAVLAAGWFYGVAPALDQARADASEREAVAALNISYEERLVKLREIADNIATAEEELALRRVQIPEDLDVSTYLGQLDALALQSGVVLTGVTANPAQAVDPDLLIPIGISDLVAVPVTITASGTLESLSQFLRAAQFGPRLLFVSRFTLSDLVADGSIKLDGFIFALPPASAQPEATEEATEEVAP
jgi:Tfp pilus assembly protein PilO